MPKKRKESREIKIIFAICLIAVIAILIFSYLDYQKQKKTINEANKLIYDSLLCISDCPVAILLGTSPLQAVFDEQCTNNCRTGADNASLILSGINLNNSRIIINSQEFKTCKQNFNSENNADRYKACLQEILPGLKERLEIN